VKRFLELSHHFDFSSSNAMNPGSSNHDQQPLYYGSGDYVYSEDQQAQASSIPAGYDYPTPQQQYMQGFTPSQQTIQNMPYSQQLNTQQYTQGQPYAVVQGGGPWDQAASPPGSAQYDMSFSGQYNSPGNVQNMASPTSQPTYSQGMGMNTAATANSISLSSNYMSRPGTPAGQVQQGLYPRQYVSRTIIATHGVRAESRSRRLYPEEAPFACLVEGCGQTFTAKHNLDCKSLNHSFGNGSDVLIQRADHMKSHNNEREHVCAFCGAAFVRLSDCNRHTKQYCKSNPAVAGGSS
jgi:hypothetical protein